MSQRLLGTIVTRLGANLVTLLVISIVTFGLMNMKAPEDVARSVLGREVSASQIAEFVAKNGLDAPVTLRYAHWIGRFAIGDFGHSIVTGRPVSKDVLTRLGRSLTLAAFGSLFGVVAGVVIGMQLALRAGSKADFRAVTGLLVIASMPEFLIGIALYLTFVVWLGWFPTQAGMAFSFGDPLARALTYVLPAATIGFLLMPHIARVARAAAIEAFASAYVDAARLRGLSERQVSWDHAFRNAALPLTSVIGVNLVYAVSGVVVVDFLFGFPGLGALLVASIGSGDVFTTQAIVMMFAVVIVVINVAVDLVMLWLNPKARFRAA